MPRRCRLVASPRYGFSGRAKRALEPPDEVIETIRMLRHAISREMVIIHLRYVGLPCDKAENVRPAV